MRELASIAKAVGGISPGAQSGPFSTTVPIETVSRIVSVLIHSATWLTSRNENGTLELCFRATGAVPSESIYFEDIIFEGLRSLCQVQVATFQRDTENQVPDRRITQLQRRLRSVLVPVSSTHDGAEADRCRRALTIGLLCVFPVKQVRKMMVDIIPRCLCKNGRDVANRLRGLDEWPTLVSKYVQSVQDEETFSGLNGEVLKKLDEKLSGLTKATTADLGSCLLFDLSQAKAFVIWLLSGDRHSAEYRKSNPNIKEFAYPTRSLQVWALAFVLKEVGFSVDSYNDPVETPQEYDRTVENID